MTGGRYRVELFRNDAPEGGAMRRVMFADEFVQITFNELRFGPEGDFVAFFGEGVWRMHHGHESGQPNEWYTDIVVSVASDDETEGR